SDGPSVSRNAASAARAASLKPKSGAFAGTVARQPLASASAVGLGRRLGAAPLGATVWQAAQPASANTLAPRAASPSAAGSVPLARSSRYAASDRASAASSRKSGMRIHG